MRILLCLVCAFALAHADESPPKEDPGLEKAIKTLDDLAKDLASKDLDKRAKALKVLRESLPTILKDLQQPRVHMVQEAGLPLRLVLGNPFGSDSMSGVWQQDGKKGTYVLRSDDKGRYELRATLKGGDTDEKFEDKGTLKELRAKHPFLKGTMVFTMPPRMGGVALRFTDTKPLFGVRVQPPTPELRHHLALPEGAGLVVHEVLPNTRAAKLGLKKHDVLLRLDGDLIDTRSQIKRLNEKRGVLEIIRRAKPKKIELGTK